MLFVKRLANAHPLRRNACAALLLWMGSLKYTSVASSTMIMALEPVFIMLGVYFLYKEKTALSAILGLGIAIGGVVFIGWGISASLRII